MSIDANSLSRYSKASLYNIVGEGILRKVLVVFDEPLLRAGVESLLTQDLELEVHCISLPNGDRLAEQLNLYKPEVVIVDENLKSVRLSGVFEQLENYPVLRVLVVNIRDNRLQIYDKREIVVTHTNDLLETIRGYKSSS